MAGLSITDLDFENHRETIEEIRATRNKLGKITVRDMTEAVYGTAYTLQMLGEDGGKDILMEDLKANDDIRAMAGVRRSDEGNNHGVAKPIGSPDRAALARILEEHEAEVDEQIEKLHEGGPFTTSSKVADDLVSEFAKLSPDQQAALLQKLKTR